MVKITTPSKLLLCLLVTVAQGYRTPDTRALQHTRLFSDQNGMGTYLDVDNYMPNLANQDFDDQTDSVCETGIWFYYEHKEYNQVAGNVFWYHGIDYCSNFASHYVNTASSVRFAGNPSSLNDDTWTVYQGTYFTGNEIYGTEDADSVGTLNNEVSSIAITGTSPWTFYDGPNQTGGSACVYPDTHDVGSLGQVMDLGLVTNVTTIGLADNSIESVKKGCFSSNIIKPDVNSISKGTYGSNIPE